MNVFRQVCDFSVLQAALKHHQLGCKLLGEPLRFQTIKLEDKQNWVTTEEALVRPHNSLFIHRYLDCNVQSCNVCGSSLYHPSFLIHSSISHLVTHLCKSSLQSGIESVGKTQLLQLLVPYMSRHTCSYKSFDPKLLCLLSRAVQVLNTHPVFRLCMML